MNLGDLIEVYPGYPGKVIGRTFEQDPLVDLRMSSGALLGIRLSRLPLKQPPASRPVATSLA